MKKITVNDLTIEEKLRLLCAKDKWHLEDLGGKLPSVMVSDGPVGLRTEDDSGHNIPAVAFPSVNTLANTWNIDCARTMGEVLADECYDRNVDVLLAPGVNIKRVPQNGRNFEYFSEDPHLAGNMAKNYISGVQSRGKGVSLKHYLANNLEFDRYNQSSEIDERTLREIYYKTFEIACEAKPTTVMCAYNAINGTLASENKKGFDVLRNEFGFDGIILSDWSAVRNRTNCLMAGLDVEYPFCAASLKRFKEDYANRLVPEEQVNISVERILNFIYKIKEMSEGKQAQTTVEQRMAVAENIAEEGIVLLKNNGVLPLKEDCTVSVAGSYAKPYDFNFVAGGGSSCVNWSNRKFDMPAELKKYVKHVEFESAFYDKAVFDNLENTRNAMLNAVSCDVAVVCCGTGAYIEREAMDRQDLRLPEIQEQCILETARMNKNTVVVLFAGSAIDVSAWIDEVAAVVYVGFAGMGTDEAIAKVLAGKVNPSGKLSETFPIDMADVAANNCFMSCGVTRYQEGLDVGYRYFDTYGVPVAFPFGFGLSYSQFEYSNISIEKADDGVDVEYDITNTSAIDGKEVSEVYVKECCPRVYRPNKELKGFNKTLIKAGETQKIKVHLNLKDFAHYSISSDMWKVEDGIYEIIVGASVLDERLSKKIVVKGGKIQ